MPGSSPGPSIKNPDVYEALRRKGYSKERAAAISNAMSDRMITTKGIPLEVNEMPPAARKMFLAAFNKANREEPTQLAALLAMHAVRKKFTRALNEKGEEEWVEKSAAEERSANELAEAIEAMGLNKGERDPEVGEGGETGEGNEGAERERASGERSGAERESESGGGERYIKKTKTTETSEERGGGGEGGEVATGDSIELYETFTLDKDTVSRFGVHMTPSGYMVAEPRIARTGIQIYSGDEIGRPDMIQVRVYRPEEEVFDRRAMTSLAHRPITLDHPDVLVDATNWKEFAVGHSTGDVARDGEYVRVPLALMDQDAIDAVNSGIAQLSVGYGARLVWGAGKTADGQYFDAKQTHIRANHIAIVSHARGGEKLRIGDGESDYINGFSDWYDREWTTKQREEATAKGQAMSHGGYPIKNGSDLKKAIQAIGRAKNRSATMRHIKKRAAALGLKKLLPEKWGDSEGDPQDSHQRSRPMTERTLNLDGVTIALEDKDGQILERHLAGLAKTIADQNGAMAEMAKKMEACQSALTECQKGGATKDGEIVVLNQKIEDAKLTPEKLDKALAARMDVIDRATAFFGDTKYDWRSKSDEQIRRDVVTARLGDQKAKAMNDAMVEGAFLSITETEAQDGITRLTQAFSGKPAQSYSDAAAKAYDQRSEELSNRWKKNKQAGGKVA